MNSLLEAMTAVFDAALEPEPVTSVTSEATTAVTAFHHTKQAGNPGNPGNLKKTVTRDSPPLAEAEQADLREALDERAALMEFDGGLPRQEAEREARRLARVYRVLVATDDAREPRWVTMLGATDDDDARRSAGNTFGRERVIQIEVQDQ